MMQDKRVIVVAGVAGSGKSTIGALLALRIDAEFLDADSLHAPANIEKMRMGVALTDEDRRPWLEALAARVRDTLARDKPLVIACSALKRAYRRMIDPGGDRRVAWIFLTVGSEILAMRLQQRQGHFMPAALLASQLDAFEAPEADEHAYSVDASASPEDIVEAILQITGSTQRR